MRRPPTTHAALAWLSLSLGLCHASKAFSWDLQNQYQAGLGSPIKHGFYPSFKAPKKSAKAIDIAKAYLAQQASALGLSSQLKELKFAEAKTSLLGQHISFIQHKAGIPIEGAAITLSILPDGTIYQVYNTLIANAHALVASSPQLSVDQAFDQAWQALGVHGDLFEEPKGELRYIQDQSTGLRLIYRIELSTLAPYGAWVNEVDAVTGVLIRSEDQRISHKPIRKGQVSSLQKAPLLSREAAFARWQQSQASRTLQNILETRDGQAKVFDPDPRTSRVDRSLNDTSSPDLFAEAYFERTLKDLSYDGRTYSLVGPWVKIVDFDPPRTAPTQSSDGSWRYERGNNGFNDAMTYFHIDQSQRYIQALGFTGASGIQFGPIEADTDGVNGDDNSYFQPSSNRLSFGHGCVDDNEDADVILHEYGHAIHYSINPRWSGADTGAIGEGFGDYWAASYSISTENGQAYAPNEVYSWDGHGENQECWPGRILNALEARYEHNRNYSAHSTIPGGFQSDELWATPIFQSLQTLISEGVAREEVDRIILQAQFGLGSQVKMRDMAQSILVTSRLLYPEGPHFQVFKTNFLRHNIIEEPRPKLLFSVAEVIDSSGDGILDPGETASLKIKLTNEGTLAAEDLELTLSSDDPHLSLDSAQTSYPRLDIGATALNQSELVLQLSPDIACGKLVTLKAKITYAGNTETIAFALRIGKAEGISRSVQKLVSIPDNDQKGIEIPLTIDAPGAVSEQLKISVQIKHPFRGDLRLSLEAPSGQRLVLQDRTGFGEDDLRGVYPLTLQPKEPLTRLIGTERSGVWKLLVQDLASTDVGSVESWGLEDISRYSCQIRM